MPDDIDRPFSVIDLPPIWLAGFAAATWALGQAWPVPMPGGGFIGWSLVLTGLLLMFAAIATMAIQRTTVVPRRAPSALVVSGVFRFTRNPIYLGDAILLSGLAVLWQAPAALLLVPVFMAVIAQRFIRGEEARLRAAFGAEFDAYARRARRWL
jgi:protein-S-isoprenylcysteine O-methyltransferase Ste14